MICTNMTAYDYIFIKMQYPLQLDANYTEYISNKSALKDSIVDEVAKWGGLENFIGNYSRIPKDQITLSEGKRTKAANSKTRNGSPAIVAVFLTLMFFACAVLSILFFQ